MFQKNLHMLSVSLVLLAACSPESPTTVDPTGLTVRAESGSGSGNEATPISFTIVPNEFVGGGPGTPSGTVTVSTTESFDRTMQVRSNNSTVLPFLSSATVVPAGSTRPNVQIIPSAVSAPTLVTIFVTGNGVTVSDDLLVQPDGTPPPPPTLSSYTVNPSTVSAGTTATGTITLPAPAGTNGVLVSLFTRIPGSASVPSSVTVPAGATSASFPITTFAGFPNSTTSVLLTATNENTTVSSSINVVTGGSTTTQISAPALLTPAADARLARGSVIAFDWSDVANAVSYTIQVSGNDRFSSIISSQTVSASPTSIAGLPAQRMWWRVRANSSSTFSAWSAARRFELK